MVTSVVIGDLAYVGFDQSHNLLRRPLAQWDMVTRQYLLQTHQGQPNRANSACEAKQNLEIGARSKSDIGFPSGTLNSYSQDQFLKNNLFSKIILTILKI